MSARDIPGQERSARHSEGRAPSSEQPPPAAPDPVEAEALQAAAEARRAGWKLANEPDEFESQVRQSVKARAVRLFNEAKENPDSDANTLVHIFLVDQVAKVESERLRQDPKLVITEERRRGVEEQRESEMAKRRNRHLEAQTAKIRVDTVRSRKQIDKLKQQLEEGKMKLDQTRRVLEQARVSAEVGQPMDSAQICRKIAEIVGLEDPAGESSGSKESPVGT
jgi:hypothetical protein